MNKRALAFLRLCRPANLPTAAADSIAGMSLAGIFSGTTGFKAIIANIENPFFLILSSVLLYAGGVVLNDFFDADIDKLERPERPIPSGVIRKDEAAIFGFSLLIIGVTMGFLVHHVSGIVAVLLCFCIISYDAFTKKSGFFGSLNMGLCRGLNLLLGISILGHFTNWQYAIIPIVFVAAITTVSRGEVHGKNKDNIILAAFLYALVIFGVIFLNGIQNNMNTYYLLFLAAFALMVYKPLIKAYKHNSPENIKKAVIAGVLSIIVLDASMAVAHSNWLIGLLLVLLLPLSILLSKIFSVT